MQRKHKRKIIQGTEIKFSEIDVSKTNKSIHNDLQRKKLDIEQLGTDAKQK